MSFRTKRKRDLEEDDYSGGIETEISKFSKASSRQNTIDSDDEEEDDEEYNKRKHNVMQDDEIEGQEADTIQLDGETKITPFNMKEEMEEGYFDGSGMYIWKKDGENIKDSWLDSIDWMKVDHKNAKSKKQMEDEQPSSSEFFQIVDPMPMYTELLKFLKPNESVLSAIKRLGGKKQLSASERLKQKKFSKKSGAKEDAKDQEQVKTTENNSSSDLDKVIGLSDKILTSTGNMDVYQETFESISLKLKNQQEENDSDMFADDFDSKKSQNANTDKITQSTADSVRWEFKWENNDNAEVHGPHTSEEMHGWAVEGYFKNGIYARKYKNDGPFYSSNRIDFSLYC